jgi:hypothetical protein
MVNKPNPNDPLDVLTKVGGLEIGGLAGLILGSAANRTPVIIDGFISSAAALIAGKIAPKSLNYMIASHCELFYRTLLSQYFGFKLHELGLFRRILSFDELYQLVKDDEIIRKDIQVMEEYIANKNPDLAWNHARNVGHRISGQKDERIIQIIDEFQFLNAFIYTDNTYKTRIELASFYQSTAESKVSKVLVANKMHA